MTTKLTTEMIDVAKQSTRNFYILRPRVITVIKGLRLQVAVGVPDFILPVWIDLITLRYSRVDLKEGFHTIFIEDAAMAIWEVLRLMK